MPSKWMVSLATVAALAGSGLAAAGAIADPTAATPPTITGTAVFGSKLTCNNGTWSAGAGSFTYAWELADSNAVVATTPTVTVKAAWVGFGLQCVVTAKDSSGTGAAASSAVAVKGATPAVTLTEARQTAAGTVTISGHVSPTSSLKGGAGSLILYRQTKGGPEQLSFNGRQTRPNPKTGAFTLIAKGVPTGRYTFVVQYVPSALGFLQTVATRSVNIKAA